VHPYRSPSSKEHDASSRSTIRCGRQTGQSRYRTTDHGPTTCRPAASASSKGSHFNDETLGARATRIASEKAKLWLDSTFQVIQKTVLNMADQGLFHCTLRFEDLVPQDHENQVRLLKLLAKQNLKGEFKTIENGTELQISWGNELL